MVCVGLEPLPKSIMTDAYKTSTLKVHFGEHTTYEKISLTMRQATPIVGWQLTKCILSVTVRTRLPPSFKGQSALIGSERSGRVRSDRYLEKPY